MAKAAKKITPTTSIAQLAAHLNAKYGPGTAIIGKDTKELYIEYFSTGSFALDVTLCGGWPYNRMIEVIGDESTCKTSLSAGGAGKAFIEDNPDGIVVILDLENAIDYEWLLRLGCPMNKFLIVSAESGEQAGDLLDEVISSPSIPICLIVDSLMAMVPLSEMTSDMTQKFMGQQPALINRAIRVANARLKSAKVGVSPRTSVIMLNQTRPNLNAGFGQDPTGSSGGQGRKFFSAVRVMFSASHADKEEKGSGDVKKITRYGKRVSYRVIKNKAGGPEETGHFVFHNRPHKSLGVGIGTDNADAMYASGLLFGVLSKKANTVFWGKQKLGGTRAVATTYMRTNYDTPQMITLRKAIVAAARLEFRGPDEVKKPVSKKKVTKKRRNIRIAS